MVLERMSLLSQFGMGALNLPSPTRCSVPQKSIRAICCPERRLALIAIRALLTSCLTCRAPSRGEGCRTNSKERRSPPRPRHGTAREFHNADYLISLCSRKVKVSCFCNVRMSLSPGLDDLGDCGWD